MNLEKPYLNEEICFLEWLIIFSEKTEGYELAYKNFLHNISLLSSYKKKRLYNKNLHPTQYINLHAHWSKTQEGYNYWKIVNDEWKTVLYDIENYEDHPEYNVKKIFFNHLPNTKKLKVKFEGD